jgi:hypothetical protein
LQYNCGGCHGGSSPASGLNLADGDVYRRVLGASIEVPELALIAPGSPLTSYLYLKLMGGVADASVAPNPVSASDDAGTGDASAGDDAGTADPSATDEGGPRYDPPRGDRRRADAAR